jgi:hypothetical protein
MTQAMFITQMRRLHGLKFTPADFDTHWEALRDLPDVVLAAAVTRAQKTRVEFPTPVELRQDADQVAHLVRPAVDAEDRSTPLETPYAILYPHAAAVISVRSSWAYYCETCSDTGWESVWCGPFTPQRKPWQEPRTCDRRGEHGSHEWVRTCACVATNPTLIRKREAARKYAERPGKAA